MKKVLISLLLALGIGTANASAPGLYVDSSSSVKTTSGFGIPAISGELSYVLGTLMVGQAGTLTFSYLGSEAGHSDYFFGSTAGSFYNKSSTNSDISLSAAAGQLVFSFWDQTSNTSVANGDMVWTATLQNEFGLVRESDYSYLLLYNDYVNNGDKDFDDMVVRVVFAPVPEPGTYALFLAGLGLMGLIMRRRRSA